MTTMQAIQITEFGVPENMQLAQCAIPQWQAGEVLIEVYASGVNRPDLVQREGLYPAPAGASEILGLEVAGIIVAGDQQALSQAKLAIGDKVCALLAGGGYAQYATVAASNCLPIPHSWSLTQAASIPETFFTVWSNIFDYGQLSAEQTLLIQGGSSGIGVTAIQMAKAIGAKVIVTAGSEAKCQACLAIGADYAINYKTQDFEQEVKQLTNKQGVHVILDMVAGDYIAKEINCLATDGKLLVIAFLGGRQASFDSARLLVKRLTIAGTTLRSRSVSYKTKIAQALKQDFWHFLEQQQIKPIIEQVFPIEQAVNGSANGAIAAHKILAQGQHVGKLVLEWKQ